MIETFAGWNVLLAGGLGGVVGALALLALSRGLRGLALPRMGMQAAGVSLLSTALGLLLALRLASPVHAFAAGLFFAVLVWASVVDLQRRLIPNAMMYPAIVAGLLYAGLYPDRMVWALAGAAFMLLFFFLPALLRPQWLGMGDAKLAVVVGLFLGFPQSLTAALIAAFAGAAAGAVLLLRGRKRTAAMAYGPCLALGGIAALLLGR
ncbi:MAG: prepilin peptidase [Chloroflexi bacterium]|nr:prepilin peptidase [Chloroflexota bacterium]